MNMPQKENETMALERKLESFFKYNPGSRIEKKETGHYIINPWDDDSLSFILEEEFQSDLIAALNNLILPPRFTALYHLDSNRMEYIFMVLSPESRHFSRSFDFSIGGKTYCCRFGRASDRLLLLSKAFRAIGEGSKTGYRNLVMLSIFMKPELEEEEKGFVPTGEPISFFVEGFENYEEDKIVEISKHINFFMQYYDRDTPLIIIHSPKSEELEVAKELSFLETDFPKRISCNPKDPFLLDLALAAYEAEIRLQFLYYYQILEYAAFYYVDDDIKRSISQIILTPDIQADPDKYIYKLMDTLAVLRTSDEAKINKVVETGCSPEIAWKEIKQNLPYFSQRHEFKGGFVIEPFVPEDMTLESFAAMWLPKTSDTLRKIRNALVHSREMRMGAVIAPTRENDRKIRPWVAVIRRIAEQVLIFS